MEIVLMSLDTRSWGHIPSKELSERCGTCFINSKMARRSWCSCKRGSLQLDGMAVQTAHLFPVALDVPGHLHIEHNFLKQAITSHREWQTMEKAIRYLRRVLSIQGLRKRARQLCRQTVRDTSLMKHWHSGQSDWIWEKLEGFCSSCLMMVCGTC